MLSTDLDPFIRSSILTAGSILYGVRGCPWILTARTGHLNLNRTILIHLIQTWKMFCFRPHISKLSSVLILIFPLYVFLFLPPLLSISTPLTSFIFSSQLLSVLPTRLPSSFSLIPFPFFLPYISSFKQPAGRWANCNCAGICCSRVDPCQQIFRCTYSTSVVHFPQFFNTFFKWYTLLSSMPN